MTTARKISAGLMLVALVLGTLSAVPRVHPAVTLAGYRVLVADFHVHGFPLSWATLAPWDLSLEARHQGLDVIAITGHNHVWVAKVGRWFANRIGGPMVLVGEEIAAPKYHVLAIGIQHEIAWNLSAAGAIDEVHRQGGVAIAAHPREKFWPAYDAAALSRLDGTEVLHPLVYATPNGYSEIQSFYRHARVTAIGDSDFHGIGPMGLCRTYVFARDNSAGAVLEAVRAGHTVVMDRAGKAYGDPELVNLARQNSDFQTLNASYSWADPGWMARLSSVSGIVGLLGLFLLGL